MTLFPNQDTFVRGELSPRLHSSASLQLYRAGLAKCENFLTLPHGGIRRRGGTYFAGETKTSSKKSRVVSFVPSADQAYALEVGDLYIRVYSYGARVGAVEVVSPWTEAELPDLQFYQSADQMWIAHPGHALRVLTRLSHTSWTLAEYATNDGPFDEINVTGTTLTPADYGSAVPPMTSNNTPSGLVSASVDGVNGYKVFDKALNTDWQPPVGPAVLSYDLGAGVSKVVDAYSITADTATGADGLAMPSVWKFEGSNDNVTWVTLDSRSAETDWANGEKRFFEFRNTTAYRFYRLDIAAIWQEPGAAAIDLSELSLHEAGDSQTPFNLTASSITGINDNTGFQPSDVGRLIRLQGSDGAWRWARIVARTSTTVVTIRLYGHALPDLSPIGNWRLGALHGGSSYSGTVTVYEERLAIARRFSVFLSKTGDLDQFSPGEADDEGMEFVNAGGGQANDIVWLADGDGYLLIATGGGIRALSGSGVDEALTPSSFKNRRFKTHGAAAIQPVSAGSSFLYVARSRQAIIELAATQYNRFASEEATQVSEHIPKNGVIELAVQETPDPVVYFPLDNGELGTFTHQPSQEVRGLHRQRVGGALTGASWAAVESVCVTPGADGDSDDVWLVVKRTIGGVTKRYIEVLQAPAEYGVVMDSFNVDCGLTYSGAATGTFTGLTHLNGQTVDVLAGNKVYRGLTVVGGQVTLPGGATATQAHVGLPYTSAADTLELDAGGRDGSLIGRRKKVFGVILSLLETDVSGLQIRSKIGGEWEDVDLPTNVADDGTVSLFTGNVKVLIDDSWESNGQIEIRHVNPTPCTIRSMTPIFDSEP